MGIFDFFGGGTPAQKALKLKPKITQKYGDPETRRKAIVQAGELGSPEAVPVLMQRFLFSVEPQTTDADEKQSVFQYVCDLGQDAVPAVVDFLRRNDSASSWSLRIMEEVLEPEKVVGLVTAELASLGAEYTRDPEKKEVLLHWLGEKTDPRVGPAALPFIDDMSDDVKIAAVRTLASVKYEPAREGILKLLTSDETAKRVQQKCVEALSDGEFGVQGYREKVETRLTEPWYVDRSGLVKKRG